MYTGEVRCLKCRNLTSYGGLCEDCMNMEMELAANADADRMAEEQYDLWVLEQEQQQGIDTGLPF